MLKCHECKTEFDGKYYSEDANCLSDFIDILDEFEKLTSDSDYAECQHEYEYVNTTPFIGHKCKKCGHCI